MKTLDFKITGFYVKRQLLGFQRAETDVMDFAPPFRFLITSMLLTALLVLFVIAFNMLVLVLGY